jgi:hypothetical protein
VFYDWSYPGRNRLSQLHRHAVWRVLVKVADPIGRVPPYGAWLWRLKRPFRRKRRHCSRVKTAKRRLGCSIWTTETPENV